MVPEQTHQVEEEVHERPRAAGPTVLQSARGERGQTHVPG